MSHVFEEGTLISKSSEPLSQLTKVPAIPTLIEYPLILDLKKSYVNVPRWETVFRWIFIYSYIPIIHKNLEFHLIFFTCREG